MPDFIDGEHPEIKFSSPEELEAHLRARVTETITERLKGRTILPKAAAEIEEMVASTVREFHHYGFVREKEGILLQATFEGGIERIAAVSDIVINTTLEEAEAVAARAAKNVRGTTPAASSDESWVSKIGKSITEKPGRAAVIAGGAAVVIGGTAWAIAEANKRSETDSKPKSL